MRVGATVINPGREQKKPPDLLQVDAVMDHQAALEMVLVVVPPVSKIEVLHRNVFHDPETAKRAIGPGDWFWRWKDVPNHLGRMYAFATPRAAAEDGLAEEQRWKRHLTVTQGMSDAQWAAWYPGQDWKANGQKKDGSKGQVGK